LNRKIPIIAVPVCIAIILIVFFSNLSSELDDIFVSKQHESIWSGPLGVTQYKHKLGESVFVQVKGLKPHEKGNFYIFTPQGILFRTISYDGSTKTDFNQYFTPDTIKVLNICTYEDLVGIWEIVFEDGSYPALEFEMLNEFIRSGKTNIQVEC